MTWMQPFTSAPSAWRIKRPAKNVKYFVETIFYQEVSGRCPAPRMVIPLPIH
jgi:hypothetical protein